VGTFSKRRACQPKQILRLQLLVEYVYLPLLPMPNGYSVLRIMHSYSFQECFYINTHSTADLRNRIQLHQIQGPTRQLNYF
jgi:hypothetical protein